MTDQIFKRPLPSFQKWLDDHGHTKRASGFEPFADLVFRAQAQDDSGLDDNARSLLRLWQGFGIAAIELCNREHELGVAPVDIIRAMPRAMACAAFYAAVSVLRDDAPMRPLARVLTEEFRFAAKNCADTLKTKGDE